MVKITILCDRCGQEVSGKVGYIAWNFKDGADGDLVLDNEFEERHYCKGCMDEIKSFICSSPKKEQAGAAAGAVSNPKAADHIVAAKRIDIGKILALKAAGWSTGKIADEMGMKPAAVSNAIYHHNKKRQGKGLVNAEGSEEEEDMGQGWKGHIAGRFGKVE